MDIAFAFDEYYADHAQVAMESVLESHEHRSDITFWLLTTDAVAEQREEVAVPPQGVAEWAALAPVVPADALKR